ncbi:MULTISPECIES: hydroxyacylglutathione hydrolase [Rhizobium/Agrobacterium group]|uniref:hydroxyacylglutathione hydrolase n=1 Tax=Rhizobium/Agrobacterium group TaxID=227290 RepID=UPI000714F896|nr:MULTISPECIES: hydroxyacylglutathione hydrolase [Rhizobium/Agrobacterium group]KQQ54326.1 hydroxyacylglutathione hydrolase [Rhizobium sp. Leaf311]
MKPLEIEVFSCRSDNFGVLLHDGETGITVSIDAPEEAPIIAALERRGWKLTHILTTHHHMDHVEANLALKEKYGCEIHGPHDEAIAIPGLDKSAMDGDEFQLAGRRVQVIATPGHTAGHICYYFPDDALLFAADTLFAMGCGRLFERPAADMWHSFQKLMALPDETRVYFGHEYTLANARFAVTVDPENSALTERARAVEDMRSKGEFTIPTTIGLEKQTNPYMRVADANIRKQLGLPDASDAEVFAEIRARKDQF